MTVHDKLFDGTCGHYPVGSVYVGNYRSGLIYGDPIGKYSGTFFSTLTGVFTPDGAPLLKMPTLQTRKFTCPTTGNCKFPVFTT